MSIADNNPDFVEGDVTFDGNFAKAVEDTAMLDPEDFEGVESIEGELISDFLEDFSQEDIDAAYAGEKVLVTNATRWFRVTTNGEEEFEEYDEEIVSGALSPVSFVRARVITEDAFMSDEEIEEAIKCDDNCS